MTQLPTQVEGSIFQMEWGYFNSFERGTSVLNAMGAQKITNLGKLPSEQKRKTPKRKKKIKIIKENSQVKKENSQALK